MRAALQGLKKPVDPRLLVIEDSDDYLQRAGTSRAQLYSQVEEMEYLLHDVFGGAVDASGPSLAEYNVVAVRRGVVDVAWCPRPM